MNLGEKINPKVSVIISNYNYGRFVSEAIQSVIDQDYSPLEIVVVDDGSTDNSRDVINEFGDDVVAVFQENSGQAQAINAGYQKSTGDIICLLDGDDYFLNNKVRNIVDIFENNKDCDFVFHAVEKRESYSKAASGRTPLQREGVYDERKRIRVFGDAKIFLPATSGYCVRDSLLKDIMPLPAEKGITISDKFLGNIIVSKAKGYYSNETYSVLRLHGDNLYSGQSRSLEKIGKIGVATAYWVYETDKSLARYSVRLSGKAMAALNVSKTVDPKSKRYSALLLTSLNFINRAGYFFVLSFYWCRFSVKNRLEYMLSKLKTFTRKDITMVYTMGKVGSSSIEKSLVNAVHTHTLYGTPPSPPYHLYKFGYARVFLRKLITYPVKRALLKMRRKINIVTLYRDPVYRDPSMFFQDLPYWLTYHQTRNAVNTRSETSNYLVEAFESTFLHGYSEWWVRNELSRFTGISYQELCLGNDSCKIVDKGRFRVFLGKSENMEEYYQLLDNNGLSIFEAEDSQNRGSKKWYASAYQEFMKSYDVNLLKSKNQKFRADNGYVK